MISDLADGTLIQFRYRGRDEVWAIVTITTGPHSGKKGYEGVKRPIVPGDIIYVGVWKGQEFQVRRVHTVKECEWMWVPIGVGSIPGTSTYDKTIFTNRKVDKTEVLS